MKPKDSGMMEETQAEGEPVADLCKADAYAGGTELVCLCVCVCVCWGEGKKLCRWMDRDIYGGEWLEETGQRPV